MQSIKTFLLFPKTSRELFKRCGQGSAFTQLYNVIYTNGQKKFQGYANHFSSRGSMVMIGNKKFSQIYLENIKMIRVYQLSKINTQNLSLLIY